MTHAQHLAETILPALQSINWLGVGEHAIYGVGGFFVALIGAYLALARDVAYIKGKIDQLTDDHETVEKLKHEVSYIRSHVTKRLGAAAVSSH